MRGFILATLLALAATPAMAQEGGFRSPSGNIHCALSYGELRCDIGQRSYTPPPPLRRSAECEHGNSVGMRAQGPAQVLCVTDTVLNPDHRVLPYGTAWQGGGFACTSSQTGIRCVNAAGRGWEMARARLSLF
jgi:hypothetical protein